MSLFNIFRRKKVAHETDSTTTTPSGDEITRNLRRSDSTDYLGQAATAGRKASSAVEKGKYDEAWEHYHKQKQLYVKHGIRSDFTQTQIVALDGSVNEDLANIRRLEKKHDDALVHLIYSLVTSTRITKSQEKKLPAYVNRAKLYEATLADVDDFMSEATAQDFRAVQLKVAAWQRNTKGT